jgi:hypothetical protein
VLRILQPRYAVLRCFTALRDPRTSRREKKHMLFDIVIIALCAVIAGADDWPKILTFARERSGWLTTFLSLPNGIPSHDTMERVFELLSPASLQRCFLCWIEGVIGQSEDNHYALDGKTLRGSGTSSRGRKPLHLERVESLPCCESSSFSRAGTALTTGSPHFDLTERLENPLEHPGPNATEQDHSQRQDRLCPRLLPAHP